MEGGKESQQAPRGRNRGTCLEMVWAEQETDTQKDEGALRRVRSTNRSSRWGVGTRSLRDGLCLER